MNHENYLSKHKNPSLKVWVSNKFQYICIIVHVHVEL